MAVHFAPNEMVYQVNEAVTTSTATAIIESSSASISASLPLAEDDRAITTSSVEIVRKDHSVELVREDESIAYVQEESEAAVLPPVQIKPAIVGTLLDQQHICESPNEQPRAKSMPAAAVDDDNTRNEVVLPSESRKRASASASVSSLAKRQRNSDASAAYPPSAEQEEPSSFASRWTVSKNLIDYEMEVASDIPYEWKETVCPAAAESTSDEPSHLKDEFLLGRIIRKCDFADMQIIGQFNHGFIMVRHHSQTKSADNRHRGDIFIVDQHASDEKYNFERLQSTVQIQLQPLVVYSLTCLLALI